MKPLKIGISGVRGIVGETFTPELAVEFERCRAMTARLLADYDDS